MEFIELNNIAGAIMLHTRIASLLAALYVPYDWVVALGLFNFDFVYHTKGFFNVVTALPYSVIFS